MASYDRALAINPEFAECQWNKGLLLLRQGPRAAGWQGYEWRRRTDRWAVRNFSDPEWDGVAAPGGRVLLYAEQGLGDTIHFARFAHAVAATGRTVILEVQPTLVGLLKSMPGIDVIGQGDALPHFDCHLPLMSVPHVLGIGAESIPACTAYLMVDPACTALWSPRLARDAFNVGIAWQGNPKSPADHGRSIPLRAFHPLSAVPGVRLVCLQKNDGIEQLDDLPAGMTVMTLGEPYEAGTFEDTAAVMMNLDLVITSDTSVAHLAGALGRPTWIVLKLVPDWRWMMDREDCPWYPTARLFRQRRRGDWDETLTRVAQALRALVRG
jgi:hypothetical protein